MASKLMVSHVCNQEYGLFYPSLPVLAIAPLAVRFG
jgi:hypothetical protein